MDIFLTSAFGPAHALAHARAAERAGFERVWLAEHHFTQYGQCPSATVLAGAMLGATSRIGVGTAACVLSCRHPVALGEEVALLRELFGERFQLGVARGGPWVEQDILGGGMARYQDGFAESVDVLRAWLSGAGTAGASGDSIRFDPVPVIPRPVAPVPIRVAATSLSTVELAAARGLSLLIGVEADTDQIRLMTARWREVAKQNGHDPATAEHVRLVLALPAASRDDAVRHLRNRLPQWQGILRSARRAQGAPAGRDLAEHVERLLRIQPIGTWHEVADGVRTAGADVSAVMCMVEAAGSPEDTLELIERLGAMNNEVA